MTTPSQEKYLHTFSDTEIMRVHPFDPKVREVAHSLMLEIQKKLPNAKILHHGSSALGIAGENDIDLGVIDVSPNASRTLEELLGIPILKIDDKHKLTRWEFAREGFKVELFLTTSLSPFIQEHLDTFEMLRTHSDLLKKYEKLKLTLDGLSIREYQRRKIDFFNTLGLSTPSEN